MKPKTAISESEIIESLKRSGYLLESEISLTLRNLGFFVETNQVIKDPITSKSREIDILAEYYKYNAELSANKIATKIKFVFEVKNNSFPIVLLTNYLYSPNTAPWTYYKIGATGRPLNNYDFQTNFSDHLLSLDQSEKNIYTQYCSFHRKKDSDELMALHPEELYSGLLKITQYCEEWLFTWQNFKLQGDVIDRNFLYLPVVILKDELYQLNVENNEEPKLEKVDQSPLIFNYHHNESPESAIVYFVTRNGLLSFLEYMLGIEEKVAEAMLLEKKASA